MTDPLVVLDAQFAVKEANTPFCRMFHFEPQNIKGKSLIELGKGIWGSEEIRTILEGSLKSQSTTGAELATKLPGGAEQRFRVYARCMNKDDTQQIVVALQPTGGTT